MTMKRTHSQKDTAKDTDLQQIQTRNAAMAVPEKDIPAHSVLQQLLSLGLLETAVPTCGVCWWLSWTFSFLIQSHVPGAPTVTRLGPVVSTSPCHQIGDSSLVVRPAAEAQMFFDSQTSPLLSIMRGKCTLQKMPVKYRRKQHTEHLSKATNHKVHGSSGPCRQTPCEEKSMKNMLLAVHTIVGQ